jgi:predicted amidohydrolase
MPVNEEKRIAGKESMLKMACCQIEPKIGMKHQNLEKTLSWIEKATSMGSQLIVLPELCISGYVFNSRGEAFDNAELVPGGRSVKAWEDVARQNGIYIVAGIAEKQDTALFNTAVLIGPQGYIGKYRKLHLWFEEKLFFEPGNTGLPVFNVPFGRLGMMICYDMWFPELPRIYASLGVDLLVIPTNWPKSRESNQLVDITDKIIISHSNINGIFIAACDRVGEERGVAFKGRSIITSNHGVIIDGPASATSEEIVKASCNLSAARKKQSSEFNNILGDRRTDVYDQTLGYLYQ